MTVTVKPQHYPFYQFELQQDELLLGGQPLRRIAEICGTPFYAYERRALASKVRSLRTWLPDGIELHYAIKANPMPALVGYLAGLVDGFDVASQAEMVLALNAGMAPAQISFAGPGKTRAELQAALAAGIVITLESWGQWQQVKQLAQQTGYPALLAIRLNPPFQLKASGMQMGGGPQAFGIDAEQAPALIADIRQSGQRLVGLHIFAGSQNLLVDGLQDCYQKAFQLAFELLPLTGPLDWINLGGGMGVPYFPGEQPLQPASLGPVLQELLSRLRATAPASRLILELGRYLVAEAGVYVCQILERKVSRGQTYLICDGGLHQNLAASGNLGQILRKNYPVVVGHKVQAPAEERVQVVGPLCTPLDRLGDNLDLPLTAEGDLIVVLQAGAYGPSASPLGFLSHPAPAELLL